MGIWQGASPYSAEQQTGVSLLDIPFTPEQAPDSNSILWRDFQISDQSRVGWIDLAILNNKSNDILGEIRWHSSWRQFCFFPEDNTIWSKGCLSDVQDAIHDINLERLDENERKKEKENYG